MPPDPNEFAGELKRFSSAWWENGDADPEGMARLFCPDPTRVGVLLQVLAHHRNELTKEKLRIVETFSQELRSAIASEEDPPEPRRRTERKPRPRIEACLQIKSHKKRLRLFSDLLIRELRIRLESGELPGSDEYRARFAQKEYQPRIADAFDQCTQAFSWRFRVTGENELGHGGEGHILPGHDDLLDRAVAIKRVRADDERSLQRLRKEARTLARLADFGVPAVYGVGTDSEGRLCLAEHLIEGPEPGVPALTFTDLVRAARAGRRFEPNRRSPEFLNLLPKLIAFARTVAAAHAHRFVILHRDLSPKNLLVDRLGRPFVIDWGLAVWLGEEEIIEAYGHSVTDEMTRVTRGGGTPGYLSPEQANDDGRRPTPATDVFCLGACLFQLMTGYRVYDCTSWWFLRRWLLIRPARGENERNVLMQRAQNYKRAPNPAAADWQADAELCDIVRKALDPEPARRYQNAGELVEALEDWIRDNSPRQPTGTWLRQRRFGFARWVRRNTVKFVLATILLTVALAIVIAREYVPKPG